MEFPCFDSSVMIFIGCSIFNSHEFQCEKWGQYNAGIYKEAVIQSPPRSPHRDQFLPLFTLHAKSLAQFTIAPFHLDLSLNFFQCYPKGN